MPEGVIIIHGCGKKTFLSKKTLQDCCAICCPGCGGLISLSLFDSKRKEQLLAHCKTYTRKELEEALKHKKEMPK